MDTMEVNKGIAAILVAGIAFFLTGLIGDNLVHMNELEKPVLDIKVPEAGTATQAPKPEPLPPIAPLLAKADVAKGEDYVKKVCTACHTFNEGGKAGIGPNLYGIVGNKHAHMEGFNYSKALESIKGPWTYEALNEWLHKPSQYAPGTRMSFAGIKNDQLRADVIDYLHTLSHNPVPFPKPEAAQPKEAPAGGAAPAQKGESGNTTGSNTSTTAQQPNAPASSATPSGAPGAAGAPQAGGSASAPAAPAGNAPAPPQPAK
jgi:cytochrome c